ncbi:hypothetical protein Acr_04g0001110 [Actinidia rufa]|uniref:Uncharacterized protein n=1 Tax=Actinidia rufa TaxID=165716 RepID=A0A7J0EFY6_9ERIC|nr:hypothetical protein Acr_04g0001110 [Actinidia rufa]
MSVSRQLTKSCPQSLIGSLPSWCRRLDPGMGVVPGNFAIQVTFCLMMCLRIAVDRCPSAKLWRGYPAELATEWQFGSDVYLSSATDCVRRCLNLAPANGTLPSLLYSESLVAVPALARLELVVVYFIPYTWYPTQ